MLPDEILEEWSVYEIREFLTYHKILDRERQAAIKKRK
jgi:hypothetical protein